MFNPPTMGSEPLPLPLPKVHGVTIKMRLGFCSFALAILIQQELDYILLKTDIHSFVLNTETFLSDIWKPR